MAHGTPLTRTCGHCHQTKRLNEFPHNVTKPTFHNAVCAACRAKIDRQRRQRFKEEKAAKAAKPTGEPKQGRIRNWLGL